MRKRTNETIPQPRLVDIDGLCSYLNIGLRTAQRIGRESGAARRINNAVRYDLKIVDAWLDGWDVYRPDDDE